MINRLAARGAVAMLLICAGAATAAAQVRVFRATGPTASRHYPVGTELRANSGITLQPGDTVVIVRGEFARVFRGPGHFAARMTEPDQPPMVGAGGRGAVGAVRQRGPSAGQDGALSRFYICPDHPRCPR